jgi:hypothetical protein
MSEPDKDKLRITGPIGSIRRQLSLSTTSTSLNIGSKLNGAALYFLIRMPGYPAMTRLLTGTDDIVLLADAW